jgi:hypothetical protein
VTAAVLAAPQSGTRIEILPGLDGVYPESVVVNRGIALTFAGVDPLDLDRTIAIDGGAGPAFELVTTLGTSAHRFRDLALRGAMGLEAAVASDLSRLRFESVSGTALDLDGGVHVANDVTWTPTVTHAIGVAAGASLAVTTSRIDDVAGTAAIVAGGLTLENVAIGSPGAGVHLAPTGSAVLRHVTLAGAAGAGIDRTAGGNVSVESSILWGNAGGDLVNVPCASVSWSLVGSVDCTVVNGNLQADPLFVSATDHHVQPGSPVLDHGPSPAAYDGSPCLDLGGGPRLLDWDGDGLAGTDAGAYEHANPSLSPGPVTNLGWVDKTTVTWTGPLGHSGTYHVYRDALTSLGYGHAPTCRDDLDGNPADTQLVDPAIPQQGMGYTYVITADDGVSEGTLGYGMCAERSNFTPCP